MVDVELARGLAEIEGLLAGGCRRPWVGFVGVGEEVRRFEVEGEVGGYSPKRGDEAVGIVERAVAIAVSVVVIGGWTGRPGTTR